MEKENKEQKIKTNKKKTKSTNKNNRKVQTNKKTTKKKDNHKNESLLNKSVEPKKDKKFKDGKFRLDILDILIIVVLTSIVSCVLTGFILNYQYKHSNVNKQQITDENINEFLNTYSEIVDNYYEEVDKKGMVEAAISGMLDYLEDNYSIYLNKDETDALSGMLDSTY